MKTFYATTKPIRPEPTNVDLLKTMLYIIALFLLSVVVPFGSSFIEYFMNACFK